MRDDTLDSEVSNSLVGMRLIEMEERLVRPEVSVREGRVGEEEAVVGEEEEVETEGGGLCDGFVGREEGEGGLGEKGGGGDVAVDDAVNAVEISLTLD